MSAIAGVYRTDGQLVNRHEVERMISALGHRGPDGTSTWSSGPAALAHAALWTTPESRREILPLVGGSGNVIVADARLDNRQELLAALRVVATEVGDGELILRAYESWGDGCVSRLIGDFAFAIWDSRSRSLFCARDHIGVKPFYYHRAPTGFVFGSEIKALLTDPSVPYRLNEDRVADHLVGFFGNRTSTFYRDIDRLPAGHTLTVSRAGVRLRPYWSFDDRRQLGLGSDEAYAEAFRECFAEAVRSRLRGNHVGCLLSGGLDTSSIVGTARLIRAAAADGNLDTFSAIFPGLPAADLRRIDERHFVNVLVGQGGLAPHEVRGDLVSPLADVHRALWHLDEAFAAPNLYLHWALYGAAQRQGVTVMLDGIDGDTTVSHGLEHLAVLARRGKVIPLTRELRALSQRHGAAMSNLFREFVLRPLVPSSLRRLGRRLRGQEPAYLSHTVIRPEFARRMGVHDRVEAAERLHERPLGSAREAHRRGMESALIPYALEMADKAAAAFGVEPRYPFFDRRLMELCLAMPATQKLGGGWTRLVMRRAMRGILPEEVRWRAGKANLTPNFTRRLVAQDRSLLEEVVHGDPSVLEEYVDIPALRRTYDRYVSQPTSERDALSVYSAVVLALWLQKAKLAAS